MNIPSKIKIGPITYKIKIVDFIDNGLNRLDFGYVDLATSTIFLARGACDGTKFSEERIIYTLCHELAHSILFESGSALTSDEVFTESIGKNIYGIIKAFSTNGKK